MSAKRKQGGLDTEAIVQAAIDLICEEGVQRLSMRGLAAKLNVDPMALYYYVSNKAELEGLIIERIMNSVIVPSGPGSPAARLCESMRSLRKALLQHGDTVYLFLGRNLETPKQLEPVENMLGILVEAGLPKQESLWAVNAVTDYVLGAVAGETALVKAREKGRNTQTSADALPAERFPALSSVLTELGLSRHEDQFEFGLTSLVRGMLSRIKEGETYV